MKIAYMAPNYNFSHDIITQLLEDGHELRIFKSSQEFVGLNKKFHKYVINLSDTEQVQTTKNLLKWADTIYFEWCSELVEFVTIQLADFIPVCKPRMVVRLHSAEVFANKHIKPDWSKIDRLIFVSPYIRSLIDNAPQLKNQSIITIANGIDLKRFTPRTNVVTNIIGCVANLNRGKNIPLVLQLFLELLQFRPELKLQILGDFEGNDPRLELYINGFVKHNKLHKKISTGSVKPEEMPKWYHTIDYLISASIFEGFGMSIGEAMASGVVPMVNRFTGAEMHWPEEIIFDRPSQVQLLSPHEYQEKRDLCLEHVKQYDATKLLKKLVGEIVK